MLTVRTHSACGGLTDVRACYWLTCQKWHVDSCRFISWMVGSPHSMLPGAVPFVVCSASLLLRTSHLQSVQRNVDRNAVLIFVNAAVFHSSAESDYCYCYCHSRRIGIGKDTQTDISYSPILQRREYSLTDMPYRSNTSISAILHIF